MIRVQPTVAATARRPRVSVAVPCYNYGRFLAQCVESVLSQDGVEVDLTIIDDASTDESVAVAEALARQDGRVAVVRHESNRGHIATFNEALASGTAEYVVKMDADDILPPGALARATALMEACSDVAFVYGYPLTFSTETPDLGKPSVKSWTIWSGQEWIAACAGRGHNVIMQPEVVMRRSALLHVGGHRPQLPDSSDFNLWLRLATTGSVGRVNGPVQGLYRLHEASMQATIHAGLMASFRARSRAFELFLDECGEHINEAEELRQKLRRVLARDAIRLALEVLEEGDADSATVQAFRDVAVGLDPDVRHSLAWGELSVLQGLTSIGGAGVVRYLPGAARRALQRRLRWRRWRRVGV